MSNVPDNSVYGGPKPQNHDQRVTLTHLRHKHRKGDPITMVTAYDYPSAVHLDTAGIDICLVGDSASMVVHGHDTTLPITLDEMLVHCRAVARGAKRPLLVGDLPFGSYESSTHQNSSESSVWFEILFMMSKTSVRTHLSLNRILKYDQAVDTAVRVLKEGGMDAIKLEGGAPSRITAAKAIVEAGIAVIGHVGLTPQAISVLGGFRPQGKNVDSAVKVVETAMALQEAGCFAVVLECVPAPVAAAATSALQIPTIGIGAGPFCSGQVLVYHDLLGMLQHPHHAKVTPKFCKQYAHVGDIINKALSEYKEEVTNGSFPSSAHSPYKIAPADVDGFLKVLQKMGLEDAASAAADAAEKVEARKPDQRSYAQMAILSSLCKNLCKSPINRHSNSTLTLLRFMSNVYGGPKPQNHNQRVTLTHLRQKHKKGDPITMVTAYDYPSAVHLDTAGIDMCLVGDSASMVVHGHDTTLPITLNEMLIHCRAVARGAKRPLLVGDLPFGSYESSTHQAVDTAMRVLKEGGMDAIKLEGGAPSRITAAKAIVEAGIAVMGHVGLTPQSISVLGGFKPQGKNVDSRGDFDGIARSGMFCAVVLECVPAPVAAAATSALQIPTIGIGAGPFCSGQVLVYHDLLGMLHSNHAKVTPKFCKQYAHAGDIINKALLEYKEEVTNGSFPSSAHSPYKIARADVDGFVNVLEKMGLDDAASAAANAAEKIDTTN
ncbi:hypothetical protein BUALT_Bualt01G0233100 [Buddleja alternifolia]|uniref:3-methyl-2-oxobutanoate hydroxymethyltransferase n=1 Tax=Buddleja alternifolia TaxID=168488 RepID=A0AAV6YH72_9LAMI|nr:hypothetical protein BUALT_Bualt01G0233100 [Buddleja alternifolia]